jgi:hypothetical protein
VGGVHGVIHGDRTVGVVGVPCSVVEGAAPAGEAANGLGVSELGAVGMGTQGLLLAGWAEGEAVSWPGA